MALILKLKKETKLDYAPIIAATSNFVYHIDRDGEVNEVDSGRGIYYGICKLEKGFVVGSRNNNNKTLLLFFDEYLRNYKTVEIEEVVDIHEICYGYRKVWMTNTHQNNIVSYDIDNGTIKTENWLGTLDHINSISLYKGDFYIGGLTDSILRVVKSNGEFSQKDFVCSGLHTTKVFDDILYICSSNTCSLFFFKL